MDAAERINTINQRLQKAFTPTKLEVIDDSDKHKGHAGSRDGAGHYTVIISAKAFENKSRVAAHREIYALLDDMIPHEIHALSILISL